MSGLPSSLGIAQKTSSPTYGAWNMRPAYGVIHIRQIASTEADWETILTEVRAGRFRIEWLGKVAWLIRVRDNEGQYRMFGAK